MKPLLGIAARLLNEWERLVCLVIVAAMGGLAYYGAGLILHPRTNDGPRGSGSSTAGRLFAAQAWAFLSGNPPQPSYSRHQAFQVTGVPFKPPKPPEPKKDPDEGTKPDTVAGTLPGDWHTRPNDDETKKPPTETVVVIPPPTAHTDKPTPPPPQPRDFLTFKGYMRSPSGQPLAYLTHDHMLGKKAAGSSTSFLEPGKQIMGMTVVEVNEKEVLLRSEDGATVKIPLHKKRLIKTQDSAPPADSSSRGSATQD